MTTSPLPLDLGPLVAAVRSLSPAVRPAVVGVPSSNVRADLAGLLGLDVSIRLADLLAAPTPERPAGAGATAEATFLLARIERRLLSLEARLDELVRDPDSSPFSLPSESLLWREVARGVARAKIEKTPGSAIRIARQVGTPYRIFVRSSWSDVKQTLVGLEREITSAVKALGDRAIYLYRIHRMMIDATAPQTSQVTEKLLALVDQEFVNGMTASIGRFPTRPTLEVIRPWRDRGGLIPSHLRQALSVVRTAFVVERDTQLSFLRALGEDLRGPNADVSSATSLPEPAAVDAHGDLLADSHAELPLASAPPLGDPS